MSMAANLISCQEQLGIIRTKRDLPPAHYSFRIQSFSSLVNLKTDYAESSDFEVDNYKWTLLFYPNGNKKRNSEGHVSMYLVFAESNEPCDGWEVRVNYRFLVYNQIQDKYFTIEDGGGRTKRFYKMKTEWGIDKLLSLEFFKDPSNGCLVNDCCILGAEISVIKSNGCGECLSFTNLVSNNTFSWKIYNYATRTLECCRSETFVMGGRKWNLLIYREGNGVQNLSLYLALQHDPAHESRKVYVEYVLKLKSHMEAPDIEFSDTGYFSFPSNCWGCHWRLIDLNLLSEGYIKENALLAEVKFDVVSNVEDLS